MKIEAVTPIKDVINGVHYNLSVGDIITVPPQCDYWVANGWAKNLDTGEAHDPSNYPVTLDIHTSAHQNRGGA